MRIFALSNIEAVKGPIPFTKLVVDGVCLLDEFEEQIKNVKQQRSEFTTLVSYMDLVSQGHLLPEKKYRVIHSTISDVHQFELKSKHLRIYGFELPDKRVIVTAGYKRQQDKDIQKFTRLVKEYLESKFV